MQVNYSKRARRYVSRKMRKLSGEGGKTKEQQIAIALAMARRKGMKAPKRER